MGKTKNRIEKRPQAVEFDEEAVREAFLSGQSQYAIAERYGKFNRRAVSSFISTNKQKWLDEARYSRLQADALKIVLPRRIIDKGGASHIMPISLPRISMHVAALQEGRA